MSIEDRWRHHKKSDSSTNTIHCWRTCHGCTCSDFPRCRERQLGAYLLVWHIVYILFWLGSLTRFCSPIRRFSCFERRHLAGDFIDWAVDESLHDRLFFKMFIRHLCICVCVCTCRVGLLSRSLQGTTSVISSTETSESHGNRCRANQMIGGDVGRIRITVVSRSFYFICEESNAIDTALLIEQ